MQDPPSREDKTYKFRNASQTLRAVVRGRVQGVGFRFFVVREARRLTLTGLVQNLPDGRVEIHARGDRESLEYLLALLRRGPILSRVDQVEVEWGIPFPESMEFTIGY